MGSILWSWWDGGDGDHDWVIWGQRRERSVDPVGSRRGDLIRAFRSTTAHH